MLNCSRVSFELVFCMQHLLNRMLLPGGNSMHNKPVFLAAFLRDQLVIIAHFCAGKIIIPQDGNANNVGYDYFSTHFLPKLG